MSYIILAGLLPVHKDARFGKHEVPEVHERLHFVHGCDCVVDQHPSVGYPKSGKYEHHAGKHLDNLKSEMRQ